MTVVSLACPNCGANLNPARGSDSAVCGYCQAQLRVVASPDGLARQVEMLSAELEEIRLEHQLRRIDERWRVLRQSFLMQGQHGESEPDDTSGRATIALSILLPVCGLFVAGINSWIAWVVALGIGFLGTMRGLGELSLARRYGHARATYERERTAVCTRLAAVQKRASVLAQSA